jgi:hypothetical protein
MAWRVVITTRILPPEALATLAAGDEGSCTGSSGRGIRVLASSLGEVDGAPRIECGEGPLLLVQTELVAGPT